MIKAKTEAPPIRVEIIVRDGCELSIKTVKALLRTKKLLSGMTLKITDISESGPYRNTVGGITPSIWVNDELWFLGSYSQDSFLGKLNRTVPIPSNN